MTSLVLLELLSVTSLLYSFLLTFMAFTTTEAMVLFYVWTNLVFLVYYYALVGVWPKVFRAILVLALAPLCFCVSSQALIFVFITVPLLLIYVEKFMRQGSFQDYAVNTKKTLAILGVVIIIRWATPGFGEAIGQMAPYLLIHLMSSVFLVRSVRHVEAGMDPRRLQGANIRYLAFVTLVYSATALPAVRALLYQGGKSFLAVLYLPFQYLFVFFGWLMVFLRSLAPNSSGPVGWLGDDDPGDELSPPVFEEEEVAEFTGSALEKIVIGLLIVLAVIALYRLIRRQGHRSYHGLDYVEERENIVNKKKPGRNRRRRRNRFPLATADLVRYYYRVFLAKLLRKDVRLAQADTSQEIEAKALAEFPQVPEPIRATYISSRYGGKTVADKDLAEMKRLTKAL